jgi:hypothetical protein
MGSRDGAPATASGLLQGKKPLAIGMDGQGQGLLALARRLQGGPVDPFVAILGLIMFN